MNSRPLKTLSSEGGAYVLHFQVRQELTLPIARLDNPVLCPGTYIYAGSAYGPGGIRARVSRHLRADKKPHWHVDYLSSSSSCVKVETYIGGNECDLVAGLIHNGAAVHVPGFGSSDCAVCDAHLVRLAGL